MYYHIQVYDIGVGKMITSPYHYYFEELALFEVLKHHLWPKHTNNHQTFEASKTKTRDFV